MLDRPRLRPVEIFPIQQDGKTFIYLKDPQNFAQPLAISPVGYFIASRFDGQHSLADIQKAYSKQFGTLLLTEELKKFIDLLDNHNYLHTARFQLQWKKLVAEFRVQPTRTPAHAGSVYKKDPHELREQLEGFFLAPEGPGAPSRRTSISIAAAPPTRGLTGNWPNVTARISIYSLELRIVGARVRSSSRSKTSKRL
jgi:hypothetical protein